MQLCVDFGFKSSRTACEVMFGGVGGDGRVITQVLANADVAGYDGQVCVWFDVLCFSLSLCAWVLLFSDGFC